MITIERKTFERIKKDGWARMYGNVYRNKFSGVFIEVKD